MKEFYKKIRADKIIRLGTYLSFSLGLLTLAILFLSYRFLPPLIPLYNQMPWGVEKIGGKAEIFIPPLIAMTFLGVNVYLSLQIYEKSPLLARILSITSLLVCILTFVFIIKTVKLVV